MTLKLKRTPGLYLVGFMCSGKTTVGRELAHQLGWCFADLDSEIEHREGKTIREIFSEQGETAFRAIESSALKQHVSQVEAGRPCVIALGGGAFTQKANWELIQNNGVTLWLDCSFETVLRRIGDDTSRPLASNRDRLADLYADRRPLYGRADYRLEVDTDNVSETVSKILRLPLF